MKLFACVLALVASAEAYTAGVRPMVSRARAAAPRALLPVELPLSIPYSLIAEIVDTDGERMYGAVDAPSWIAPLGGILLISTALLPV